MSGICLVLRFTSFCLETLNRVISGAEGIAPLLHFDGMYKVCDW